MNSEISLLLDLQQLDQEWLELQDQLNRYPGIWDEVKETLRKKTEVVDQAKSAVEDHNKERQRIEKELRATTDKLKKYQTQQMMVKTSKELTAISTQIDTLKKTITRLEELGIALIEKDEAVKKRVAEEEAKLNEAKAQAKVERERIREQVTRKSERIEVLKKDRGRLSTRVAADSIKMYDRARKRWAKDPVVSVRHGSCTGCNFSLLPNVLVAVHNEALMVTCDHCGRLLSHDETQEAAVGVHHT